MRASYARRAGGSRGKRTRMSVSAIRSRCSPVSRRRAHRIVPPRSTGRDARAHDAAAAELYRAAVAEAPESYYADLSEARLLESAPPPPAPEPIVGAPPESLV